MKKITLLMALFVTMVTTAVAQEAPVAGKFYVFNSAYDGFVAYEKSNNYISCQNLEEGNNAQIWYVEAVTGDERVRVRNLSTGRYMVDRGGGYQWNTCVYATDASLFYVVETSEGHTLNTDNNTTTYNALHCNESKDVIGWVASESETYSHWTFTEVSVETASLDDVASALSAIGVHELELTTEEGQANRIWANKPHTTGADAAGGVAALLDDDKASFLHTDYSGDKNNTPEGFHCLYVDLGENSQATHFAFDYITRSNADANFPASITVQGCETETGVYVDLYTINNLPQSAAEYTVSDVFGSETAYRYLRFKVSASGVFFHMAEFNLYTVNSDYAYKSAAIKKSIEDIQYQIAKINAKYTGNETWIEKSLYTSISYALAAREYPFTLTADVNNPVYYAIKSARTTLTNWSGDYYWTFVPYEGKLTIFPGITEGSKDYEKDIFKYWFFMENEDGKLMFIPFVDKENPMGYKTVVNGKDKMTNDNTQRDYVGNTYTLAHQEYADGYSWAFQPFGTNNYVSNNGGNPGSPKMGFWNGDGFDDTGGRVCFVEIENEPVEALADLYLEIKAASEAAASTYPAGTAVGQYTQESYDAYVAKINEQKSVVAGDATAADVETACATARTNIQNAESALQINMPVAGRFYRIRDNARNYILNDGTTQSHGGVAKIKMASGKATAPESVYYYDGQSLLAYKCGQYISSEVNRYAAVGATGSLTIVPSSTPCYFNIKNSNGTSMHSSRTYTDRCSSVCGTAHDFAFEEVTWLPIKISSTLGVATFYSPVALYTYENRVKAYAAKMSEDGTYVSLVEVNQDGKIPANTPVYLTYVEGSQQDNGHSYIQIDYGYTAEYQGENEFKGTLTTVTTDSKSSEGTIYSLKNGAKGVGFYIHGNANLSGFKAYLPVAMAGAAQSIEVRFDGATSIDDVVTEEGGADAAIYDLTGRRVEKAEKGIYIVNGKKIFVK